MDMLSQDYPCVKSKKLKLEFAAFSGILKEMHIFYAGIVFNILTKQQYEKYTISKQQAQSPG